MRGVDENVEKMLIVVEGEKVIAWRKNSVGEK